MSWEVRTMQSKTSYFNATLFRKNLTRFWPLWGLASFIGALFPLAVLLDMVHRGWNVLSAPDFTGMYYDAVSAVPVINLVYAALCAMAVWSYLYNARSVGLMHTLPIRREGLFLTNFLSGLSMTLIPYAVTGVLCVVVSLCGGAFDVKGLAVTVLAVLGESFFYFSSATFVAFITGNAFTMPPLYALLHFLAVLLDWLISSFAQGFIFGFSTYYTGVVEWLSPTVYLVNNVRCARQYVEVQQTFPDGTPYTSRLLTSADLESFWLIGVYALVGLALAALALILYRRRRSETAGDVVAVGWLRPVFRYGVAGLCALLGGQFLYSLFWYGFQQGEYYDTLPMVVCLLAAGAIGYYGASMLLAKAFKVFRGSWKGLGIVLAGCALVCCVLHFDLLGVADRVPEASQIQTLEIRIADNTYTLTPEKDADLLEQDLAWLGLVWDEGGSTGGPHGPYYQSECADIYTGQYKKLEAQGLVYPCFCSRAQLHAASAPHTSDGNVIYPGTCRGLTAEEIAEKRKKKAPAYRLMVPDENITFTDGCMGEHAENLLRDCGDFYLRRADGVFAYQLAVVVDDARMGVTEVVRGADLLSSTARQLYLYRLLGLPAPKFAHCPLLLASDGRRLSKRDGDQSLENLRARYTAEDIVGRLAYAYGLQEEPAPRTPESLIKDFSWDKVPKKDICLPEGLF